jgi:hypothetical protein
MTVHELPLLGRFSKELANVALLLESAGVEVFSLGDVRVIDGRGLADLHITVDLRRIEEDHRPGLPITKETLRKSGRKISPLERLRKVSGNAACKE